jgi:hypothetical protein
LFRALTLLQAKQTLLLTLAAQKLMLVITTVVVLCLSVDACKWPLGFNEEEIVAEVYDTYYEQCELRGGLAVL